MMRVILRKKAQAMVEMGILGGVVLVAFGIVVTYIAKMNSDQWQLQAAFRHALKKSHDDNKAIGYGTYSDRRQANAQSHIIGDKISSSGGCYAYWAIPSVNNQGEDPEGKVYVKVNYQEYDLGDQLGGSVAPEYYTFTNQNLVVNNNQGATNSVRSAAVGEAMSYQIGGDSGMTVWQGRGYGGARAMSAGDDS